MFSSLWRRLWNGSPVRTRGKCHRAGRHHYRPRLEPLEDRTLQASLGGMAIAVPLAPGAVSGPQLPVSKPSGADPIRVTVNENASATVVDLGAAFAAVAGLQHGDGLKFSILGNTNSGLVKPTLSEAALCLTYVRGKSGTATITVCATDADGVSA